MVVPSQAFKTITISYNFIGSVAVPRLEWVREERGHSPPEVLRYQAPNMSSSHAWKMSC